MNLFVFSTKASKNTDVFQTGCLEWDNIMVSSIRTPMLIQGRLERTETNQKHCNQLTPSDAVRKQKTLF